MLRNSTGFEGRAYSFSMTSWGMKQTPSQWQKKSPRNWDNVSSNYNTSQRKTCTRHQNVQKEDRDQPVSLTRSCHGEPLSEVLKLVRSVRELRDDHVLTALVSLPMHTCVTKSHHKLTLTKWCDRDEVGFFTYEIMVQSSETYHESNKETKELVTEWSRGFGPRRDYGAENAIACRRKFKEKIIEEDRRDLTSLRRFTETSAREKNIYI